MSRSLVSLFRNNPATLFRLAREGPQFECGYLAAQKSLNPYGVVNLPSFNTA